MQRTGYEPTILGYDAIDIHMLDQYKIFLRQGKGKIIPVFF